MKNELNELILKLDEIRKNNPAKFEKLKCKLYDLRSN